VALLQDATPLVLVLAWVGLVGAVLARSWPLAAFAAALCAYHVVLVARLLARRATPRWVRAAPTTTLALANVYVDNDEFDAAARQLLAVGADLLIVVETTPEFRAAFDRAGGAVRYPHRTFDADDDGAYAVSLYSASAPTSIEMVDIGALRAARAVVIGVEVGGRELHVVGAIPMAAVDPGGYDAWRRQIHDLGRYADGHREPLVVAGDLNTTIHRSAFRDLESAGLVDAHDALGLGLRPSFKLAAKGLLARLGPLVRLDHALLNDGVWAVEIDDLDPAGSDHRPFVATLAVRPPRHRPGHHATPATAVAGGTR
jgi:endonuclease/exonuclease/phosphatase (EEP) superfamily protein YafD